MSIIGSYRYSSAASGSTVKRDSQTNIATIVNVGAFAISGLSETAGFACCMFDYNYDTNKWIPMSH